MMSWNDSLSYQENVDKFLDSLKDFSKTEDDQYKITKELLDRKRLSTVKVFRKRYQEVFKRIDKDLMNVNYISAKDLVQLKYKDELMFSYKPAKYIFIPDVINMLKKQINIKEVQLRDFRDGYLSGNPDSIMIKNIEKLKVDILELYEKQSVLREIHDTLNKKKELDEEHATLVKKIKDERTQLLEFKKEMREHFESKDIHKFEETAKKITKLQINDLELQLKELKASRLETDDYLLLRLPEIVENNKEIKNKKKKKTVKKPKESKADAKDKSEKQEEEKAKPVKKTKKTSKETTEQTGKGHDEGHADVDSSKKDMTLEETGNGNSGGETQTKLVGGFNLIEHITQQMDKKKNEFDEKEEFQLNIESITNNEQSGSGMNDDFSKPTTEESFHTTPPFSPSEQRDMNEQPVVNQTAGATNEDPFLSNVNVSVHPDSNRDIKQIKITGNAIGGSMNSVNSMNESAQTGGADPFATPDLEPVNMGKTNGFEDMTQEINNTQMTGAGYGDISGSSPGVFDSTYTNMQEPKQNSGDIYNLGEMPVNVNVIKTL